MGDSSLLNPNENCIAIIGARSASPAGIEKAYELGKKLAGKGNIIVKWFLWGVTKRYTKVVSMQEEEPFQL